MTKRVSSPRLTRELPQGISGYKKTASRFGQDQVVEVDLKGRGNILWTIFVVLLVLWLLGLVSSYTLGGYIHILLLVAIAVVLIRVIQGRKVI